LWSTSNLLSGREKDGKNRPLFGEGDRNLTFASKGGGLPDYLRVRVSLALRLEGGRKGNCSKNPSSKTKAEGKKTPSFSAGGGCFLGGGGGGGGGGGRGGDRERPGFFAREKKGEGEEGGNDFCSEQDASRKKKLFSSTSVRGKGYHPGGGRGEEEGLGDVFF